MSPPATTPALDLERITEDYLAAWASRDPDRIAAMHTDDTRFEIHAGGGPVHGRAAAREAFAGLFAQWPDFAFEVHRVLLGERHWVLEWTLTSANLPLLDVVEVDPDGFVSRKDTYLDPADLEGLR